MDTQKGTLYCILNKELMEEDHEAYERDDDFHMI